MLEDMRVICITQSRDKEKEDNQWVNERKVCKKLHIFLTSRARNQIVEVFTSINFFESKN